MVTFIGDATDDTFIWDIPGSKDHIFGENGADTLGGGAGKDALFGGAGQDVLFGGSGADILNDGAGKDVMFGGAGDDLFTMSADGRRDVIKDFRASDDRINLAEWGVLDYSELTITEVKPGKVKVVFGDETLIVNGKGLTAADMTADQFDLTRSINFDDLTYEPGGDNQLAGLYDGFIWNGTEIIGDVDGVTSGDTAMTFQNVGQFASQDGSEFAVLSFKATWVDGHDRISAVGVKDGVLVDIQTQTLQPGVTGFVELDQAIFGDVDNVIFRAATGAGEFVIDDIAVLL